MVRLCEFYKDQTIFLTGATGFIGKLILEKLLRSCPDLKKIYILLRTKSGKTLDERLNEIISNMCFDEIRKLDADLFQKISVLSGDCALPKLGLSAEDEEIFKTEVTCVIHSAANVRFDIDLRTAVNTNLRSVRDLLDLLKEMENLKAFVYVSTGFSQCIRTIIDEKFYEVNVEPKKLMELVDLLDDNILKTLTPHLLSKWPNTYVYTKAMAENLIRDYIDQFPISIIRPVIITPSCNEPCKGWIEGLHGLTGPVVLCGLGALRSLHMDLSVTANLIPADFVVNSVLASAWNSYNLKKEGRNDVIPIYNCCPHKSNLIKWGRFIDILKSHAFVCPLRDAIWYHFIHASKYEMVHKIRVFFYHTIFSYLVDGIFLLTGKAPTTVKKYRKINKMISLIAFVVVTFWHFESENLVQLYEKLDDSDKIAFNFNMKKLDWDQYWKNSLIGGRTILMKDPLHTIPKAKKKMYILKFVHYFVIILLYYFLFHLLSPLVKLFL